MQAARADAIRPVLVFLNLLVGDVERVGELLLAHVEHASAHADSTADVQVSWVTGVELRGHGITLRRAIEVIFGAHTPPVRCVIWDMLDGGARLAVAHPLANLPRTFTLVLFKGARVYQNFEVVRTDARYVGVKFIMAGL